MTTTLFELALIAAWVWRRVWPALFGLGVGFLLFAVFFFVFALTGGW